MEFPQRNATGTSRFAGLDKSVSNATTFGLILWIASSYWFKKQYFIKDKNLFNLVMFSSASLFSSMAISRTVLESPYAAAARRNNINEYRHQHKLGHL